MIALWHDAVRGMQSLWTSKIDRVSSDERELTLRPQASRPQMSHRNQMHEDVSIITRNAYT